MEREAFEAYHKYAPRWFKVIQWRRLGRDANSCMLWMGSALVWMYLYQYHIHKDSYAWYLYLEQPKTDEERLFIKRQYLKQPFRRDHEIHHYEYGVAPPYDMWERRRKYPEYYAGRYEGDGPRFGDAVQKKTPKD